MSVFIFEIVHPLGFDGMHLQKKNFPLVNIFLQNGWIWSFRFPKLSEFCTHITYNKRRCAVPNSLCGFMFVFEIERKYIVELIWYSTQNNMIEETK